MKRFLLLLCLALLVLPAVSQSIAIYGGSGVVSIQSSTVAVDSSLSTAADFGRLTLVAVVMPAAWTAAEVGFQAAPTAGGAYQPVYRAIDDGARFQVTVAADRYVTLSPLDMAGVRYVKLESLDVGGSAVNQAAGRAITLVYR